MKLIDANGTLHNILTINTFQFKGKTKINRGFWRWVLALLIFWPALFLIFFVGDEVMVVEINGKVYHVSEEQYKVIMNNIHEE